MDSLRAVRFAIAVVSMSKRADGAIRDEEFGRVETIRDLCEQRLSTSQARCILKARTLVEVDGCTGH